MLESLSKGSLSCKSGCGRPILASYLYFLLLYLNPSPRDMGNVGIDMRHADLEMGVDDVGEEGGRARYGALVRRSSMRGISRGQASLTGSDSPTPRVTYMAVRPAWRRPAARSLALRQGA